MWIGKSVLAKVIDHSGLAKQDWQKMDCKSGLAKVIGKNGLTKVDWEK